MCDLQGSDRLPRFRAGMAAPFPETTMRRLFASLLFSFLFLSGVAAADSPPVHLKGAIQSVNGQVFTMSGSSAPVAVKLTDQTRIASLETAQLADITQGMFVGTAALP